MRLNNTTSGELEVFSGVPQGSILGPLLFLVFMNDLPSCVMSATFGYADDYKIVAIVADNPLSLSNRCWETLKVVRGKLHVNEPDEKQNPLYQRISYDCTPQLQLRNH